MSEEQALYDSIGRRKPKNRGRFKVGTLERKEGEKFESWIRREHDIRVQADEECQELKRQFEEAKHECDLSVGRTNTLKSQIAAEKARYTRLKREEKRLRAIHNTAVKRIYTAIEKVANAQLRKELGIRHTWIDPLTKRDIQRTGRNRVKTESSPV